MPAFAASVASTRESASSTQAVYSGRLEHEWAIGDIPQGGYSLSVMLTAVMDYMRRPELAVKESLRHPDPMHLSAAYLVATQADHPCQIHMTVLKRGKTLTTIETRLTQESERNGQKSQVMRIHCMVIMTNFAHRITDKTLGPTIDFKHPLSAHCPVPDPKDGQQVLFWKRFRMANRIKGISFPHFTDQAIRERNKMEGVQWLEIYSKDGDEVVQPGQGAATLPFFADFGDSPVYMLPGTPPSYWLPTLHLTVEFKRAVPFDEPILKAGIYATGRHLVQGQNDADTEVWSHPEDADRLGLPPGQKSAILCISRQIALALPIEVNFAQNKDKKARL